MRCGLVWECPLCQVVIKTARAEEVTRVVEWHVGQYGQDCAAMLTNTIRHGAGDSLEAVRRGLSKAWRYVQAGRGWVDARKDYGLVGYIRAMEPTHGRKNGWHPHLHIVLLTKRPLPDSFRRWVLARWQRAVERTLGPEHMPDNRHGCDLSPLHSVDYIQKLGLEVAAPNKEGRGENRTPLQILRAFAEDGDLDALNVWQSYVVGMKGARMLTWSRGLKDAAGLSERTDQDIIDGDAGAEVHVVTIKGEAWDVIRDVPGMKTRILQLAESHVPDALAEWLGQLSIWPPGFDPLVSQGEP